MLGNTAAGVCIVDDGKTTYEDTITAWVIGQSDKGQLAIIINPFSTTTYRNCKVNNIVNITLDNVEQLQQFRPYYSQSVITGFVETPHLPIIQHLVVNHPELHLMIQVRPKDIPTIEKFKPDFFIADVIKEVPIQRGNLGGWSTTDKETIVTISTLRLNNWSCVDSTDPIPTTLVPHYQHIQDAFDSAHTRQKESNIPVYNGSKNLPITKTTEEPTLFTLLGYNLNGVRASWVKDDWDKILQEKPEILCLNEIKCTLGRLKRYLGGEVWSKFRELYPYIFVHPAMSPTIGQHGTMIACRKRPDA